MTNFNRLASLLWSSAFVLAVALITLHQAAQIV